MVEFQCSHEENFEWLNHEDDGNKAVKIANPKTLEFQVVRTTLIPGLLKTIRENRSHPLPIKIFETSGKSWCRGQATIKLIGHRSHVLPWTRSNYFLSNEDTKG